MALYQTFCIFYLNSGLCKTPERLTLTYEADQAFDGLLRFAYSRKTYFKLYSGTKNLGIDLSHKAVKNLHFLFPEPRPVKRTEKKYKDF